MIRAFVALPLPDPLRHRLTIVQHSMRLQRPIPAENFHITLAFLGDQPEHVLEEFHVLLASKRLPMPRLQLDGLGVFGGNAPRNLHACLAKDPRLSALQSRVTLLARQAGISVPSRKFIPHISLARFGIGDVSPHSLAAGIASVGAVTSDEYCPEALVLYRSTLLAKGPVYDPLAEYPLSP